MRDPVGHRPRTRAAVLAPPGLALLLLVVVAVVAPSPTLAHAPLVVEGGNEDPATAFVLEDPAKSLALGSTLVQPGETDWYRMELAAGAPLVVAVTAPDADGGIATDVTVIGPGLPPADASSAGLVAAVGGEGALRHPADPDGERAVHGGLGFIEYGGISTTAPATGTYWIAVTASASGATGKYVLAPGVEERFGPEDVAGMAALVGFFEATWPPEPGTTGTGSALGPVVVGLGVVGLGMVAGAVAILGFRRSRRSAEARSP
ncbi:MAG TPA: hypothetical protein VLA23_09200 [Candidatus Limnocylindrales bacterium]|nr:hypothetical protein [Candidatus Limnocylindrales bacterium]